MFAVNIKKINRQAWLKKSFVPLPNGNKRALLKQEIIRLGDLDYQRGNYIGSPSYALLGLIYFKLCSNKAEETAHQLAGIL
jgi:hypothetical protein